MRELVCIYEGNSWQGFASLTDTRAVWDLRCGAFSFAERLSKLLKRSDLLFLPRAALGSIYSTLNTSDNTNIWQMSDSVLFIKGNAIIDPDSVHILMDSNSGSVRFASDGEIVAFRVSSSTIPDPKSGVEFEAIETIAGNFPEVKCQAVVLNYPWLILNRAAEQIALDLTLAEGSNITDRCLPPDVEIRGTQNLSTGSDVKLGLGAMLNADAHPIRIGDRASLGTGCIVDALEGPVWIDDNVKIEAGAILSGPLYIGSNSIIRSGARVSGGTCLGPHSRVGGEVSATIIQGFSNKQHSGYLGGSYIGSWVNLGAATDNSDLKNNYRPIEVTINGKTIDTGCLHFGSIIGDYCRAAIHTRLNTGTVVGLCCNLFGNDFPMKELPPFTWYGGDGYFEYRLDKAIDTIRVMMSRRGAELTPALEKIITDRFRDSQSERETFLRQQPSAG